MGRVSLGELVPLRLRGVLQRALEQIPRSCPKCWAVVGIKVSGREVACLLCGSTWVLVRPGPQQPITIQMFKECVDRREPENPRV